jgi:hypothetical protein
MMASPRVTIGSYRRHRTAVAPLMGEAMAMMVMMATATMALKIRNRLQLVVLLRVLSFQGFLYRFPSPTK